MDGGPPAVHQLKQREVVVSSHDGSARGESGEPIWRERGACRGIDATAFFPDEDDAVGIEFAKSICSQCSVRVMCLEYALTSKERVGVWGGATERERRRIIRQRRRTA
jgi:WhiB family transcriptional regulator, redox-sensing transcriptional regulator